MTPGQTSEYATEAVPDSSTVGWIRVMLVSAMVAFSLPIFLTGVEVSGHASSPVALAIIGVGILILTFTACLTGAIGSSTRLSSYMLNRIAFGSAGASVVNLAFGFALLGWFGVNINLFSGALIRLARDLFHVGLPVWPVELFAGVIMTVTTLIGFRAIHVLSTLLVPVLMVVTAFLILGSIQGNSITELFGLQSMGDMRFGDGVSSVVGAVIVGAVILPDITRYVRHWHQAIFGVLISYAILLTIVIGSGWLASSALQDKDFLNIMVTLGLGWAAFAIIILGSWVLNSLNLYSALLSVQSTTTTLSHKRLTLLLGALGTVAAFLNILNEFMTFLFYLSIIFVPVAGVVSVDYLFLRRDSYHGNSVGSLERLRPDAMISWALGACVSLLGSHDLFRLSGIAAVDAMLVSAFAYILLTTGRRRFGTRESIGVEDRTR